MATSLAVIAFNSLSGLAAHTITPPDVDLVAVGVFAVSAMAASFIAGTLAPRLPAVALRRGFAVLVLAVAAGVAATSLAAPRTALVTAAIPLSRDNKKGTTNAVHAVLPRLPFPCVLHDR